MSFQVPKDEYAGKINTTTLGKEKSETIIGGEQAMPFYSFEGKNENRPIVAMSIYDRKPEKWPDFLLNYYTGVVDDPIAWARKCIEEFGADAICLHLTKISPDVGDMTPAEAAELTKSLRESIDKPLIVYANAAQDIVSEVMKKVSEKNAERNILLGWVEEDNYKTLAASAIAYKNNLIASSPLDVNIAKQLNILLTQLGLPAERIVMDPSTSGLGYGIEYCFSAMERLKIAALLQDDKMTQMPIINNIAAEIWKVKEVKETEDVFPEWGNVEERAINWEAISSMCFLLSGSNIVTMVHPKAVKLIKEIINELLS